MTLEPHEFELLTDIKGSVGGLEQSQRDLREFIQAVSLKLAAHTMDPDAHPASGRRWTDGLATWVAIGISFIGLAIVAMRHQ